MKKNLLIQVELGICRDIRKFTCTLENLELEQNDQDHVRLRANDVQTDYFNDSDQEENALVFKTREMPTFQMVIQGPEILNFQVRISCGLVFIRDVIVRI